MQADPFNSVGLRTVAPREWLLLGLGWMTAVGVVWIGGPDFRQDTLQQDSHGVNERASENGSETRLERGQFDQTGGVIAAEIDSIIDAGQSQQMDWRDWAAPESLSRDAQESLLQHAIEAERIAASLGRSDWRQRSNLLAVAGICYATGGASSPKYCERGADALVASADIARENGAEAFALICYQRAVRIYDGLLELLGNAPSDFRARITRKRAFIGEELNLKSGTLPPIASREVAG